MDGRWPNVTKPFIDGGGIRCHASTYIYVPPWSIVRGGHGHPAAAATDPERESDDNVSADCALLLLHTARELASLGQKSTE